MFLSPGNHNISEDRSDKKEEQVKAWRSKVIDVYVLNDTYYFLPINAAKRKSLT